VRAGGADAHLRPRHPPPRGLDARRRRSAPAHGVVPDVLAAGLAGRALRRRDRHGRGPRHRGPHERAHPDAVGARPRGRLHHLAASGPADRARRLLARARQRRGAAPRPRLAAELDGAAHPLPPRDAGDRLGREHADRERAARAVRPPLRLGGLHRRRRAQPVRHARRRRPRARRRGGRRRRPARAARAPRRGRAPARRARSLRLPLAARAPLMTLPAELRRLEALAETALKLARTAPSGRLALARLADAIETEWLPEPWRSELPAELRAAREATCVPLSARHVQRRFHRALRGHPAFVVAPAHTALARESVLVTGWVEGTPIARCADPDGAAAQLIRFMLSAARFGTVHANPHLEDALVLADGRL